VKELKKAIKDIKFISVTTDIWLDKTSNQSYIAYTIHYIKACKSLSRNLGIYLMKGTKNHSAIKEATTFVMDTFIDKNVETVFTTENGRNIIKAMKNYKKRYACAAHNLNLVLKHTFKLKLKKNYEEPPQDDLENANMYELNTSRESDDDLEMFDDYDREEEYVFEDYEMLTTKILIFC